MHEFSIAQSLVEMVQTHIPPDSTVQSVTVEAGPMRGIEPDAMQWAWQAATSDLPALQNSAINLVSLNWKLECMQCGLTYEAEVLDAPCRCGSNAARPVGGDQLVLMSIEVLDQSVV